jgi:Ca2+-binding RTX toxin-like protein
MTEDRVILNDARTLSYQLDSQWPEALWWLQFDMYAAGHLNTSIMNEQQELYVTGMTIIKGGNDKISGGAGDDICIGGTGDDWIEGNSGNDIIVGDHALTPSAIINSTMLPTIFHSLRYVSSSTATDAGAWINKTYGTSFIVNEYISSYETLSPLSSSLNFGSWQSSTLSHLISITPELVPFIPINSTSGSKTVSWKPTAIVYGNVITHGDVQYGNDKLYGGHGNDFVIGDSLIATTLIHTENVLFDEANQRVASLSSSVAFRMASLYQSLNISSSSLHCQQSTRVASDVVVDMDNGINIVVGDNMLIPSIAPTFTSITSQQLDNEAVVHYNDLADAQLTLIMIDTAVAVAQQQVRYHYMALFFLLPPPTQTFPFWLLIL